MKEWVCVNGIKLLGLIDKVDNYIRTNGSIKAEVHNASINVFQTFTTRAYRLEQLSHRFNRERNYVHIGKYNDGHGTLNATYLFHF